MYPDGGFIFHQDSAPSHTAKATLNFLKKIKFISPQEWLPKSPDCAPMDYFVWGYLKRQLWKYKASNIQELKELLKEWKKLPQELINSALKRWRK